MDTIEKCQQVFYSEYKIGFRKYIKMHIFLYHSYLQCKGIRTFDGTTSTYDIKYTELFSVKISTANGQKCLKIKFKSPSLFEQNREMDLYVLGLDDFEKCQRLILHHKDLYTHFLSEQSKLKTEQEEKKRQAEIEAKKFYDECYNFHISENTPTFTIYSEDNRIVLVYIDVSKAVGFLKIDGYEKSEDVGIIPYDNIHYYEKAGNVHYVSETNGSYSSFGGSLTGATFSKKAALFSGILFGLMGMATATLMSYKPAQQKPTETQFEITSDTKRIDERNVLLNFYSNERNQYIDIELPQEIYNFLQTHLPEKKHEIVSEVEKHFVINKTVDSPQKLDAPSAKATLPDSDKLSLDDFREKVEKLKIMKEAGLLSNENFQDEKSKLLTLI